MRPAPTRDACGEDFRNEAATLGPSSLGAGTRWVDVGGADPELVFLGMAILGLVVPTPEGHRRVCLGAATAGLLPFDLPGP